MKALSFSRLCLFGALIIGLLVAWSVAAPQQLRSWTRGGCKNCWDVSNYYCKDLPGDSCSDYCYKCDLDEQADKTCINASHCSCNDRTDGCENVVWHESCD